VTSSITKQCGFFHTHSVTTPVIVTCLDKSYEIADPWWADAVPATLTTTTPSATMRTAPTIDLTTVSSAF
jgi:hypothetical protein